MALMTVLRAPRARAGDRGDAEIISILKRVREKTGGMITNDNDVVISD